MSKYIYITADSEHCFDLSGLIGAVGVTFTVFSGLHAQTQCLPYPPLFHGRMSWAESFFAGFGDWYSYKPQAKNPSQVFIALSKRRSHQLH